jgi:hypothetical protein
MKRGGFVKLSLALAVLIGLVAAQGGYERTFPQSKATVERDGFPCWRASQPLRIIL